LNSWWFIWNFSLDQVHVNGAMIL